MRCIERMTACVLLVSLFTATTRAESLKLEESAGDGRVFQVTAKLSVTGNLLTEIDPKKAQTLPLKVEATHRYLERRLTGAGRDAEAFRSLRQYQTAEAAISVDKTQSSSKLNDARKLIVVQGRREGVTFYSPNSLITRSDIGLLSMPGDSLAMLCLLPRTAVEKGEKWNGDSFALQFLAAVDAVSKSDLSLELVSTDDSAAKVKFTGTVEGATVGAATSITLSGTYEYDLKGKYIRKLELEQKEKRSVGAVSPGMDVAAKLAVERSVMTESGVLTDAVAEKVPLEPDANLLLLQYETPWNIRMTHDRDWHVFHDTAETAVLRLLDKGLLVAQVNLRKIPPVGPGKHTTEETFQADIQKVLGDQLKTIANAEQIKTEDGRFLYRVTVIGEGKAVQKEGATEPAKPRPMQWIYYLCAAPGGEQCALVFAVDASLVEKLGNRDLSMVKSLQFLNREPTKAP